MAHPYRHIRVKLNVRFRATHDVKFRFDRPGVLGWPFNSKYRVGQFIPTLECDHCVIYVAAQDIPSLLATIEEDPSLIALVNLFSNFRLNGREEEDWPVQWQGSADMYVNRYDLWESFIHCGAAEVDCWDARGFWVEEQYHWWKTEEDFELYSEWCLDGAPITAPPERRIVESQCVVNGEEILAPWQPVHARSKGYGANGVFYPYFPEVEVIDAELIGFVMTEEDDVWGEGRPISREKLNSIA